CASRNAGMPGSREPPSFTARALTALCVLVCASCSRDTGVHPAAAASTATPAPPDLRETPAAAPHDAAVTSSAPPDAGPAPEKAGAPAPRLGSIGRTTWIYAAPQRKTRIGYLRPGTSVALKGPDPLPPEAKSEKRRSGASTRPRRSSSPTPRGGC